MLKDMKLMLSTRLNLGAWHHNKKINSLHRSIAVLQGSILQVVKVNCIYI